MEVRLLINESICVLFNVKLYVTSDIFFTGLGGQTGQLGTGMGLSSGLGMGLGGGTGLGMGGSRLGTGMGIGGGMGTGMGLGTGGLNYQGGTSLYMWLYL